MAWEYNKLFYIVIFVKRPIRILIKKRSRLFKQNKFGRQISGFFILLVFTVTEIFSVKSYLVIFGFTKKSK